MFEKLNQKGARKIDVVCPPASTFGPLNAVQTNVFMQLGFVVDACDLNYHINTTRDLALEGISKGAARKIKKALGQ